jgi:hypothetical protein
MCSVTRLRRTLWRETGPYGHTAESDFVGAAVGRATSTIPDTDTQLACQRTRGREAEQSVLAL